MEFFFEMVNTTAEDLDLINQSKVLGYFVPSITANYKFRLESTHLEDKGDDWNLYFETENKTLVSLISIYRLKPEILFYYLIKQLLVDFKLLLIYH